MKSRWIIAGAAALALGLLTLPMLRSSGREHVAPMPPAAHAEAAVSAASATCDVESAKGKLDFVVNDMHKAPVKLADYKGKVVLLNFWATWCGPCKEEIPSFVELYEQYKDKGLVIVGVSIDDAPETLRAFAQEWHMQLSDRADADRRRGQLRTVLRHPDVVLDRARRIDLHEAPRAGDEAAVRTGDQSAPVV